VAARRYWHWYPWAVVSAARGRDVWLLRPWTETLQRAQPATRSKRSSGTTVRSTYFVPWSLVYTIWGTAKYYDTTVLNALRSKR
jgi:hypothetical protein